MGGFTSEDFARARFAEHESGTATAARNGYKEVWVFNNGFPSKSDAEMAAGGWVPVRVANGRRDRDTYIDHIADQDRVIRRRNDEIAALRRELRDAQAPLSLDALAAAWEAAEQADECREGDVLIIRDDEDNYLVRRMDDRSRLDSTARILSRAPKREPWQDLADVLQSESVVFDSEDASIAARALHNAGVRVTGGDDDE